MGDYSDIRIQFAELDFDPEERQFMNRLWQRYFEPVRSVDYTRSGAYDEVEELRRKVHIELGLPGTDTDWGHIWAEEIEGQRYYQPLGSLSAAMIPPFPRRFAQVPRLRCKYGIHDAWFALFSVADRRDRAYRFVTTIDAARRQFATNFEGLWRLLWVGLSESDWETLLLEAPPRSARWRRLSHLFEVFPFNQYFQTLGLLAGDRGHHARIEFGYAEILYNYDKDWKKADAVVHARHESIIRILDALGRLDIASACDEAILESCDSFSSGYPGLYLEVMGDSRWTDKINRYFNP